MQKKRNITLYTAIGKPERIPKLIQQHFSPVTLAVHEEGNKMELILQDNSTLTCYFNNQDNNPEFVQQHCENMGKYFAQVPTEHEMVKENWLRQIACFNALVGIVFEDTEEEGRTNYIINTLLAVIDNINGFILFPSMEIYNAKGELVFSASGQTQLESFTPIANPDLIDRHEMAPEDLERAKRSFEWLKRKQIPFSKHLPCILPERKAILRNPEEILTRLASLFAVSVYSEAILTEGGTREEALQLVEEVQRRYPTAFTPKEMAYLKMENPDQHTCIQFSWRYECCHILLWALGFCPIEVPDHICDVSWIASVLWNHNEDEVRRQMEPLSLHEVLDTADLTHRYHWACVEAHIHNQVIPAGLEYGVVQERHYALNWLIGANEQADWDLIEIHT